MRDVVHIPRAPRCVKVPPRHDACLRGKFVVFQVDAQNLLGIVNRGSPRLNINELARELFWLCVERDITILRWNGCRGRRMPWRTSYLSSSSPMIEWWVERHSSDWRSDGGATLWTSSRRLRITSANGSTRCTGAAGRRVVMLSPSIGVARRRGSAAPIE